LKRLAAWQREGKIRFKEDVLNGIERVPEAFLRLTPRQKLWEAAREDRVDAGDETLTDIARGSTSAIQRSAAYLILGRESLNGSAGQPCSPRILRQAPNMLINSVRVAVV
jgi:hypothetical protein